MNTKHRTAIYLAIGILILTVIVQFILHNHPQKNDNKADINQRHFSADESLFGTNYFNIIVPRKFEVKVGEPTDTISIFSALDNSNDEKLIFEFEKKVDDIMSYVKQDIEQFVGEGNILTNEISKSMINKVPAYYATFKHEKNENEKRYEIFIIKYYLYIDTKVIDVTLFENLNLGLKSNREDFKKIINSIVVNDP